MALSIRHLTLVRFLAAVLVAGALNTAHAQADALTQKSLRVLIGYAPGSGADVVARLLATKLQETFPAGVVVENKPGAGGSIAMVEVARATPDGTTLLLAAMPQIAILPVISKVPYNVERDFAPIAQSVGTDLVLVTNPAKTGAATMAEFMAWARRQSLLFFGTPGPGTVGHFGAYLAAEAAGTKVEPIHYRTTAEQMTGIINGDIHAQFYSYAAALPIVKSGKVRVLMTTSPVRSPMFPDAPTPAEAGYPQLQFTSWYGWFTAAGTPAAALDRLNAEIVRATRAGDTRGRLEDAGLRIATTTRAEFATVIREDSARWGKIVAATGFKQD